MNVSRTAARTARVLHRAPLRISAKANLRNIRLQSTSSSANTQVAAAGGSSGLVGGIAGGSVVFAALYGYYHFSGAKTIVNAASSAKEQVTQITKSLQSQAPEPNELLRWFRQTATSYATFIPGAKTYVEAAFNDIDAIEKQHRGEVDAIVSKAYADMKEATKGGLSIETAQQSWEILQKALKDFAELASNSAGEVLENHPEIKEKVGGNLEQLKGMANAYGPEAKKELDKTYAQIKNVLAGGLGVESVDKIRQIVQEKLEEVKKIGDEAWKKGLEQAKPFLDKNPKIREQMEKNADVLKQGNIGELYDNIKKGNAESIQKYIDDTTEKAKNTGKELMGPDMEKYMKMVPGGEKFFPMLAKLQEAVRKQGEEAEKIMKETYEEIGNVLQKRIGQIEKIAEKAKKDTKK